MRRIIDWDKKFICIIIPTTCLPKIGFPLWCFMILLCRCHLQSKPSLPLCLPSSSGSSFTLIFVQINLTISPLILCVYEICQAQLKTASGSFMCSFHSLQLSFLGLSKVSNSFLLYFSIYIDSIFYFLHIFFMSFI